MTDQTFYREDDEEEENYASKCLCVLCLDTSNSMNNGDAIGKLSNALATFKDNLSKQAKDYLELAVISFNSKVDVLIPPTPVTKVQFPDLKASGQTQIVAAIEQAQQLIQDRKTYWKSHGMSYYRPYLVVMTDGDPYPITQDVDGTAAKIKTDTADKRYQFVIVGVGSNVSDDTLNKLASDIPPMKIETVDFGKFFEFLSHSTESNPGGDAQTIQDDWKQFMKKN